MKEIDDLDDRVVVDTLTPLMGARRLSRLESVLARRTYGVSVVLEDLLDNGNISAVMRTCDAFGVQRVHLIRTTGSFKSERRITQGAHKWLDIYPHRDPLACVERLHDEGYQVYASRLDDAVPIDDLDFSGKVALVFGNERIGVSSAMADACDVCFKIPMVGFAQSMNVSVAAAVSVYHVMGERRRRGIETGDLDEEERQALRARWYRRSVKSSDLLLKEQLTRLVDDES